MHEGRKLRLGMALLVGVSAAGAAWAAQAPETFPPGEMASYERRDHLFGPGSARVEPFKIVGNIYYVGAADIAAYLITTPKGHFLIDTGMNGMAGDVLRNIEKLGFKLSDVEVLLNSHAHFDHVAAHAWVQRVTGAAVMTMEADAEAMATGKDRSSIHADGWEPIPIARILKDNEEVRMGGTTLRAIWTPGHTPGNTTWVTTTQDGGMTYQVVIGGTANPVVGNPPYDTDPQAARTSYTRLKALNPQIILVGHPMAAFAGKIDAMRAGQRPHPLAVAPGAWAMQVENAEAAYLKREQAALAGN